MPKLVVGVEGERRRDRDTSDASRRRVSGGGSSSRGAHGRPSCVFFLGKKLPPFLALDVGTNRVSFRV